jgi:penicillin-binding protein 1C
VNLLPALRRPFRRALAAGAVLAGAGMPALLGLHFLFPFPAGRLAESGRGGSAMILDRQGGLVAWRVDPREDWRLPVPLARVSPWLVAATVAAEDKRFFSHHGVDPAALARALRQNLAGGRRVSGASTITMQAVRLLWPQPRTYGAKTTEALRALQLERLAGKEEIAGLYLNLAPYGGNVVGAEAAARFYFGKGAAELTLGEAALLAGIPQRPAAFNPRRHLAAALQRREYVLARMRELGLIAEGELNAARRTPLALAGRPRLPDAARFADWVVARQGRDCGQVRTTLDPGLQAQVCATARRCGRELAALGIDGLAAAVLDVGRSELLAMVGSADPGDPLAGQVNAAASARQPGSLLKPFIYARAFDSGLLTPDSVVYDVPTAWRGYRPENIDRVFQGPIPAQRALAESRNLPAVRLLDRLSPEGLAADMAALGLPHDAAVERCGLSLALGTAEVRLVDMANAYAALARLGQWRPLRVTIGEAGGEGRRAYSPGAAYLTLRSLGAAGPGDRPQPAWKTGTSWNQRDAWAVVVTPSHVVAVWCGKLSGEGHPELLGARTALPIALALAGHLPDAGSWPRPDSVRPRRICALSGSPAGRHCPCVVEGECLPGVSSEAGCRIHQAAGGVEVWPPEVAAWLAAHPEPAGQRREHRATRARLSISSPLPGAEYILAADDASTNLLPLEAAAPPGTGWVYWFLDGELFCRAAPGQAVLWPLRPGRHEVLVSDGSRSGTPVSFAVFPARGREAR